MILSFTITERNASIHILCSVVVLLVKRYYNVVLNEETLNLSQPNKACSRDKAMTRDTAILNPPPPALPKVQRWARFGKRTK